MSIKKFEEYIGESNKVKFHIRFQDDDYSIMDKTFLDIDLSKIPIERLRKQYVNFKSLLKSPPMFGDPLMSKSKQRRLNEGTNRETLDIELVRESIMKNYLLDEWQFDVKMYENEIRVALIVPHIGTNEDSIVEDMMSMGYYETIRGEIEMNNMSYTFIRFDPRYPKDITDIVRKMRVIKHLTPKYNLDSIRKNGFIPLHKNEVFNYPPRIHFLKENIGEKDIIHLGEQLFDYNSNPKNNGEYVLLTLDVKKIPDNVEFTGDSCYKYGICTENEIPFECVVDIKEYNFS